MRLEVCGSMFCADLGLKGEREQVELAHVQTTRSNIAVGTGVAVLATAGERLRLFLTKSAEAHEGS